MFAFARWDPKTHPDEALAEAKAEKQRIAKDYTKSLKDLKYKRQKEAKKAIVNSDHAPPIHEEMSEDFKAANRLNDDNDLNGHTAAEMQHVDPIVANAREEEDIQAGIKAMMEEEKSTMYTENADSLGSSQLMIKHYLVFGFSVFISFSAYIIYKRYKQTYLSDRTGAKLNQRDVELMSNEEAKPFLD